MKKISCIFGAILPPLIDRFLGEGPFSEIEGPFSEIEGPSSTKELSLLLEWSWCAASQISEIEGPFSKIEGPCCGRTMGDAALSDNTSDK